MPLLHKIAGVVVVCAVILGLTVPAERRRGEEAGVERVAAEPEGGARAAKAAGTPAPGGAKSGSPSASASAPIAAAAPGAAAVKANELGQVPVLMYHRIVEKPDRALDRTPKELHDELTRLAKGGYSPITAAEFVGGRFNVPAGKHPVVLTFDDGTPDHFALDAQGRPKAGTAVEVIQRVAAENPGFRPVATFYMTRELFGMEDGQAAAAVPWLVRRGYEIGNHTMNHPDLGGMSAGEVREEIGEIEDRIVRLTGEHATTLAYPFGVLPRKPAWARKADGKYEFQGAFLAGWRPSVSPFDEEFDRWEISRVRSEGKIEEDDCKQYCSTAWLEHLDKHPEERYTSDGDPNTVTFPKAAEYRLAKEYRGRARTY